MEARLFELADKLKALRDRKQELEDELKAVTAERDETDARLAAAMIDSETQNFSRAGVMFSLTTRTHASPQADNKAALFSALRVNGYGELVYETVNSNTLSAFVKEQMAENQDELPPWLDGLVNVHEKVTVGVRKAGRKG